MSQLQIPIPKEELAALCQRHHIRWLALFGSALRNDFGPESDVDLLVEFEPGHVIGWDIVGIEEELAEAFGRKVDLVSRNALSRWIRGPVLRSAEVIYGAARPSLYGRHA